MTHTSCGPLLHVEGLNINYRQSDRTSHAAVIDAALQVSAGEIVGVFGESGSGKTSLALALLNLLPATADRRAQVLRFRGHDLLNVSEPAMRSIRGRDISIMYQEPALALNPVMRVGDQIAEVIRSHERISRSQRRQLVWKLLHSVSLESRPGIYDAYAHELSGGERHRIVIAQALACNPSLVIADEPTAGLDPELKPEIMDLIARLRTELNVSFLVISHDRKMLARIADRLLEMSAGRIRERAIPSAAIVQLQQKVFWSIEHDVELKTSPLMIVRGAAKSYSKRGILFRSHSAVPALQDVNLSITRGSTLALVGPSGSGKSTLARCMALWERFDSGEILFNGNNICDLPAQEIRKIRPRIQLVLQDSAAAFNPNLTAKEIVEEPLLIQGGSTKEERRDRVIHLLQETGLDDSMLTRKALEFSGGQRQRLAIARALILNPELIIFDESTTGIDRKAQQHLLLLLEKLRRSRELTYVFISHDHELVSHIADSVATMRNGTLTSLEFIGDSRGAARRVPDETFSAAQKALALGETG